VAPPFGKVACAVKVFYMVGLAVRLPAGLATSGTASIVKVMDYAGAL